MRPMIHSLRYLESSVGERLRCGRPRERSVTGTIDVVADDEVDEALDSG